MWLLSMQLLKKLVCIGKAVVRSTTSALPSFSVSPHKEIFYCFGCHVGGDVISFIAKAEHCSPIEAAQHLIDRYQLAVPQEISWEKSSQTQEAKDLYYQTC